MKARLARLVWPLCLLLGAMAAGPGRAEDAKQTDPYEFVAAYIRALGEIESGRQRAKMELRAEKNSMAAVVRNGARTSLELGARIRLFESMRLDKPFDWLIPSIVGVYRQQLELNNTLVDTARTFLEGPKPGVDYARLAAGMPEITAQVEFLDQTLFKATPAVFAALIDSKPDSQNHVSHLIITKAQRKGLVTMIDRSFGQRLAQKDQNWTVSSASVLRSYLVGDHKSSDDPW